MTHTHAGRATYHICLTSRSQVWPSAIMRHMNECIFCRIVWVRLLPGVMGRKASAEEESFTQGLLEYPQYTRPQVWEGHSIPEVLTGGDHAKVAAWRRAEAERLTRERRPDLWSAYLSRSARPKQPR